MRIDIRKEVAACVRKLGGVVLDDSLKNPQFSNADYWFPDYQVVVELKCLTDNLTSTQEFNNRLSRLYTSWVRQGYLPQVAHKRVRLNIREIPLKCAREFLDPIKHRLEVNVLKKANAQIKGIKKHFNQDKAKGLLLLVNDGDYIFSPDVMAHLLARSMRDQYRSINSVIYFSVNEFARVPGVSSDALFWVDGLLPNRDPVSSDFRKLFKQSWIAHHSNLSLEPISEISMNNDPNIIDGIKFINGLRSV